MISNRCTVLRNGSNVLSGESNERRKDEILRQWWDEVDNYYKDKTDYLLNEEILRIENLSIPGKLSISIFLLELESVGIAGL